MWHHCNSCDSYATNQNREHGYRRWSSAYLAHRRQQHPTCSVVIHVFLGCSYVSSTLALIKHDNNAHTLLWCLINVKSFSCAAKEYIYIHIYISSFAAQENLSYVPAKYDKLIKVIKSYDVLSKSLCPWYNWELTLGFHLANERRRYEVTPSLIGCVQT